MSQIQVPDSIFLYEGKIPGAIEAPDYKEQHIVKGILRVHKVQYPTLSVYLPEAEKANGAAVIICPGGGYGILAMDHEGYQLGEWFQERGVAAFVLKYRLPDDQIMEDRSIGPLQDAQQAIRMVRKKAKAWNIDPQKIGIMGFSAGGHLASTALTMYQEPVGGTQDTTSIRPDFGILIYPVISFNDDFGHKGSRNNLIGNSASQEKRDQFSTHLRVDADTPPTFLISTADDYGVPPDNSYAFFKALQANKVNTELHIYAEGGHGYGMGDGKKTVSSWPGRLEAWLLSTGFIN